MSELSFCLTSDCPYTECPKHYKQIEGIEGIATFGYYGKTCRKYIHYLVELCQEDNR